YGYNAPHYGYAPYGYAPVAPVAPAAPATEEAK
ncbi:MAG TPA: sulfur globule protein CV1, partial [Chromatiales bacterium]|nr:sulfur globule protein CV1 [Chromatiales bacterium]